MSKSSKDYVPADAAVLAPYICPRECAKAIAWYGRVFGAVEKGERYVDRDGRVGHAAIVIDGAEIMLSDGYPDYGAVPPRAGNKTATFALSLYVPDVDTTMRKARRAGAVIQRPPEEQFHGSRMGTLVDPFGVRWMISTYKRYVTAAELARAAAEYANTGAGRGPVK
jgi:PhnB protein